MINNQVKDPQGFFEFAKEYQAEIVDMKFAEMLTMGDQFMWFKYIIRNVAKRGGCIIRADLLETIRKAFDEEAALDNLMFSDFFQSDLLRAQNSTRLIVQTGLGNGIPRSPSPGQV